MLISITALKAPTDTFHAVQTPSKFEYSEILRTDSE